MNGDYITKEMAKSKECILDYINNSTLNNVLYDLARKMRHNGLNYWADKLEELI